MWGVLFYSLFRFRARRGRAAPQITRQHAARAGLDDRRRRDRGRDHDHHATSSCPTSATRPRPGPASLAEARGQYAAINQPPPPDGKGIEIQVSGQQYLWRYQYPNGTFSFQEMVVPRDMTVVLKIKANDVVHSWWIPKLGGKMDAVPGYTNETWFKATENGVFDGPVRRVLRRRTTRT